MLIFLLGVYLGWVYTIGAYWFHLHLSIIQGDLVGLVIFLFSPITVPLSKILSIAAK